MGHRYKVGDVVRIREDLTVGNKYGGLTYYDGMQREVKEKGNVVTIAEAGVDLSGVFWYNFEGYGFSYSDEMTETIVESLDYEKFKAWMTKLAEIDVDIDNEIFCALERVSCYYSEECHGNEDGHILEDDINTLWEYINRHEAKKMTKAEIEEALGYKIEIVD